MQKHTRTQSHAHTHTHRNTRMPKHTHAVIRTHTHRNTRMQKHTHTVTHKYTHLHPLAHTHTHGGNQATKYRKEERGRRRQARGYYSYPLPTPVVRSPVSPAIAAAR